MPFRERLLYSLRENSLDDCLGNMWPAKLLGFTILLMFGWSCGERAVQYTAGSLGAVVGSGDIQMAAYTHYRADGNRLVDGWGSLPEALSLDIPLDGLPEWLVAASTGRSSIWVAILSDGRVQAFRVADRTYAPVGVGDDRVSIGMPPRCVSKGDYAPVY